MNAINTRSFPSLRKLARKSFVPSARPFMVTVMSKGTGHGEGQYYVMNDDRTMILQGICLYNVPVSEKADCLGTWNPLTYLHGCGFGLVLQAIRTPFKYVVPIEDVSSVTAFRQFKGMADTSGRYFRAFSANALGLYFADTFTDGDIQELLRKYDGDFVRPSLKVPTRALTEELKVACKSGNAEVLKSWASKGYPCAYRYGFSYRGAKAKPVSKSEALAKIGHVFEYGVEELGGQATLVLQDYSDNDMW